MTAISIGATTVLILAPERGSPKTGLPSGSGMFARAVARGSLCGMSNTSTRTHDYVEMLKPGLINTLLGTGYGGVLSGRELYQSGLCCVFLCRG
jgi:hypothetical protein